MNVSYQLTCMLPVQLNFAPSRAWRIKVLNKTSDIEAEKAPDIAGPTTALDIVDKYYHRKLWTTIHSTFFVPPYLTLYYCEKSCNPCYSMIIVSSSADRLSSLLSQSYTARMFRSMAAQERVNIRDGDRAPRPTTFYAMHCQLAKLSNHCVDSELLWIYARWKWSSYCGWVQCFWIHLTTYFYKSVKSCFPCPALPFRSNRKIWLDVHLRGQQYHITSL